MAYTTIDKPDEYFNTKLYTGNGGTQSITGVGFAPDWVWTKNRSAAESHELYDTVRGATKRIMSQSTAAENIESYFASFNSDGFTFTGNGNSNASGNNIVAWNWKANETLSKTYAVTVVSSNGNKYRFDGFATNAVTLELSEGLTFRFDQSDASNSGHPLLFSTTSNGTHGGGVEYTTGVTVVGTPGSAGSYTEITVATSAPTLYYYCFYHSGMGGQANTPTTNSFSNFSGSIQSNISPNTTAGFSIVSYTGTGSAGATIGHGLGAVPRMIIVKNRDAADAWQVYHAANTANPETDYLVLNTTAATADNINRWNDTLPTSTLFSIGDGVEVNTNTEKYIAYCFAEKKGYSKFGSYTGNGNADGTFVYTGFKPSFIMYKNSGFAGTSWAILDNKRNTHNVANLRLFADSSSAEDGTNMLDILSNGFKARSTNDGVNRSGNTIIYMAFAEHPFVTSTSIPTTAR